MIFHANRDQKKARVTILISDKIYFKTNFLKRDKEEHYIMIKGYAPNIGALEYLTQILISIKGEINSNTVIVGDFNTPLISMDRPTKQKINKDANFK